VIANPKFGDTLFLFHGDGDVALVEVVVFQSVRDKVLEHAVDRRAVSTDRFLVSFKSNFESIWRRKYRPNVSYDVTGLQILRCVSACARPCISEQSIHQALKLCDTLAQIFEIG